MSRLVSSLASARRAMRLARKGQPRRPSDGSWDALLELARRGPAPLEEGGPAPKAPPAVAAVVPSFRRGSGGHATIVHLLTELRARGHEVSLWLEDCEGRHRSESAGQTAASFRSFFDASVLALEPSFRGWQGADIVLATGWQTVARSLLLPGARARAYLVQDHEPDFYGASAEAIWAADSYRHGLHCLAASPWLAELLRTRYGAHATHFDLAVDHGTYAASDAPRRTDLVVFYARAATPRRAVPLGILALGELARRRPEVEIVLFGEDGPLPAPFPHRNLGTVDARALALLYSQATVGMVLSLTNPSLVGLEMMACGLACVELASEPVISIFGSDGPLELAQSDPLSLCHALERLLDDADHRREVAQAGLQLMAERTWQRAAEQVADGLSAALGVRR